MNRETYEAFARAWVAKDVDRLMDLVTDDIVYGASVGPEPGTTYRGREAVRAGFAEILAYDKATAVRTRNLTFVGDRLYAEWEYDIPDDAGGTRLARGMDIIEFRGGRISLKEAFRKSAAGPIAGPATSVSPPMRYAQRRFGSLGLWVEAGFRVKAYGITTVTGSGPLLPPSVVEAARAHVAERLSAAHAEGGHYGVGYAMVHAGLEANWLLLDWWAYGDIGCHVLSSSSAAAPTRFEPVQRPLMACVWELVVTAHERDAWVRHMMSGAADVEGYLGDRLADGLY